MLFTLDIVTVLLCLLITWQDMKYRSIPVLLMLLFALISGVGSFVQGTPSDILLSTGSNLLILLVLLGGTAFYFYLKRTSPSSLIGLGDIILLFILTLCFHPISFILFFIISCLAGLLSAPLIKKFDRKHPREIPLAGIMCALYAALNISGINFHDENGLIPMLP